MKKKNEPIDVSTEKINDIISILSKLLESGQLGKKQKEALVLGIKIIESFLWVVTLLQKKNSSIKRLKKFIFGSKSEKSSKINEGSSDEPPDTDGDTPPNNPDKPTDKEQEVTSSGPDQNGKIILDSGTSTANIDIPKSDEEPSASGDLPTKKRNGGGGKNGHDKYTGAHEINCPLKDGERVGDICPKCGDLKLQDRPQAIIVKLTGAAPVSAIKFIVEKSFCLCGAAFSGIPPKENEELFNGKKYSPSALASILTQKFDMGVPYGALGKLQDLVGVPVPATTQANKIRELKPIFESVFSALERFGANSDIIGFDDTRILILKGEKLKNGKFKAKNGHGSVFVCKNILHSEIVILYNLNFNHAGIYLQDLLSSSRTKDIDSLICICDGLPCYQAYAPDGAINSNCNVHSRRNFVYEKIEEADFFSKRIIELYKLIYKNEKDSIDQTMTAKERLLHHQENSSAAMEEIINLCRFMVKPPSYPFLQQMRQELEIPEYLIPAEPNADLFKYADYILKRIKELTNFLRVPGVPLDTNEVERLVKAIIEIRKKGFFFYTEASAVYAGKILSLIETAQANKVNSFEYFEFIIQHSEEVVKSPESYLPWNYQASSLYSFKQPYSSPAESWHPDNSHSSIKPEVPWQKDLSDLPSQAAI